MELPLETKELFNWVDAPVSFKKLSDRFDDDFACFSIYKWQPYK